MSKHWTSDVTRGARYPLLMVLFALCYIAIDWATFIEPLGHFNITAWNPQPALAIVWMTYTGASQWPVVFAFVALADIVIRGAPAGYAVTTGSAFTVAAGYALISFVLSRCLRDRSLGNARDLAVFTATVIVGAAVVSGAFVSALALGRLLPPGSVTQAWLRFWLGDVTGILGTGPLLFALADRRGREGLHALLRQGRCWVAWVTLCALLALLFWDTPAGIARFYLLLVPIAWIGLRFGMAGAVVATVIVQLGVVVNMHVNPAPRLSYVEIQLIMCILSVTGLFLAVIASEYRRASAELRALG